MLPVDVARSSSDGNAIRYVLPVLWMTSCFHTVEPIGTIRDDAYVLSSSPPNYGIGGEVCRLRLHLVEHVYKIMSTEQCCSSQYLLMFHRVIANCVHKSQARWIFRVDGTAVRTFASRRHCSIANLLRFAVIDLSLYFGSRNYTVFQKKGDTKLMAVTLSFLNRFSKFFH